MISIVIPNYNSAELLAKNLPKLVDLLKKSKLDFEIIVADDASTDDSVQILKTMLSGRVKLSQGKKNLGFGANVDRGIRASHGEVVFVLNAADALPEKADYFPLMLKHFDNPEVFSVGAAKQEERAHGQGIILFHRGLYLHFHNIDDYKKWLLTMRTTCHSGEARSADSRIAYGVVREDDRDSGLGQNDVLYSAWADGGAQAIRKDYYLKIGGFDSIYQFYWEDVDLGFRAWKAGYKIIYESKAVLVHRKDEGPIAKRYSEKERYVMNLRNQFIFTWKNADLKHLLLYNLWEPYHLLVALKGRNWLWFKAYVQAFSKWPEIVRKRIIQKRLTKNG